LSFRAERGIFFDAKSKLRFSESLNHRSLLIGCLGGIFRE
jgi:hypothetical protein